MKDCWWLGAPFADSQCKFGNANASCTIIARPTRAARKTTDTNHALQANVIVIVGVEINHDLKNYLATIWTTTQQTV